jgi:2-C-methyl-D-erythritol 2,4-cyclodiphosphate synthase/2-C-methyl-D-erythritol 4-phosphate cytidylyltransferase
MLGGISILERTLRCFAADPCIDGIVLVLHREDIAYCRREILERSGLSKIISLVAGGAERCDSVRAGLDATTAEDEIVLVHDAVRPFVSADLIRRVVDAATEFGAALSGLPVKETIKVVDQGYVAATPPRKALWGAQTPQGFCRDLVLRAHNTSAGGEATDDAMMVEALGHKVKMVAGDEANLKITTSSDLRWAERQLGEETVMSALRVGQGYDVHRLQEGRRLVLGGVEIPFHLGLAGHSDADVLTHAIIDALLGAMGAGDIGRLFPDDDAQYKDISSLILLERVRLHLEERGGEIVNIDAVVMAERPKLAPYIDAMRRELAQVLKIDVDALSLKATTTERLGFVGREEGFAAQAVVLVQV